MAKKIAGAKKKPSAPKAASKEAPRIIDYPKEHEIVLPGHYSIRLTAHGATEAQVRIDGGEWAACREAAGHFWHDWAPQPGAARIEARARKGKGRWTAEAREAVVKPNELSFTA